MANSIFGAATMVFIYDMAISGLRIAYALASKFNAKAREFRLGRREQLSAWTAAFPPQNNERPIWFHCASLGEFEQGRPVMEGLKNWNPKLKILLTFFSPSGYQVRKNYAVADYVFYLPWDTRKNAQWLADHVTPSLAIFVKYEFWYHYTRALRQKNVPLISISAIFRPEQMFFRSYGAFLRRILGHFNHFFVQNKQSLQLLHDIGIGEVTVAGDTRFDRVKQIAAQAEEVPAVGLFKGGHPLMVIGSAWPEDMEVLFPFIREQRGRLKFIIAPHEIDEGFLSRIETSVGGRLIRFSRLEDVAARDFDVLLVDNVGLLSRLYRYCEFAFVGGGFSQGLHNILEAACYGVPVFFGNKAYEAYQEAVDLVLRGGAFEVADYMDLKVKFSKLTEDAERLSLAGAVTRQYVFDNLGATDTIIAHCKKLLT